MRKFTWGLSIVAFLALAFFINFEFRATDTISLHIGKPYEDVIRDSTFPVKSKTVLRPTTPPVEDSTWFTSPVIVKFDDTQHGFILPPTKFGAVGYNSGKVTTITTSPMLETLPFDQLIPLLDQLQEQLKTAYWAPKDDNEDFGWIKTSNDAERNTLQNLLFDHAVTAMLLIPHKYGMSLIVKCYARCSERNPKTAKYLIDVSIGKDFYNR